MKAVLLLLSLAVTFQVIAQVEDLDAQAVQWYRKAAEQGFARAQFNLGVMYRKGQGVTKNDVRAYVWFSAAAAQGNSTASKSLDLLEKLMTPEQIAKAQQEANRRRINR